MKHGLSLSVLVACAAAGVLTAYAFAGASPSRTGDTTTGATTTTIGTTTTVGTTTVTVPQALPEGVTVGGVLVGGLLPADASTQIRAYYSSPLKLRLGRHVFTADATTLATPQVAKALERARTAQPFANLGLVVIVKPARVKTFVATLAKRVAQPPVDARLLLRNVEPYLTRERPGISLVQPATVKAIARELRLNSRDPILLRTNNTPAKVTRADVGPVIVIRRGSNRLYL